MDADSVDHGVERGPARAGVLSLSAARSLLSRVSSSAGVVRSGCSSSFEGGEFAGACFERVGLLAETGYAGAQVSSGPMEHWYRRN
ncbi:MAG TPA: hypothetical protein VK680_11855 [Solirubrobacteraceae bacterium]|nr:hypothetical protein [Solirubrobacteraceae bacterium]